MALSVSRRTRSPALALFLAVIVGMLSGSETSATQSCAEGWEMSNGVCKRLFTQCKLRNPIAEVVSSWVTLETETCNARYGNRKSCVGGKLSRVEAANACNSRGFFPMDFFNYVNPIHGIRPCVDQLFTRMVNSGNYGNNGEVAVWTHLKHYHNYVSYHHAAAPYVTFGNDQKYALCTGQWVFHNNMHSGWSAAKIYWGSRFQRPQFASDTCKSIGYDLISVQDLNKWKHRLTGLTNFMGMALPYLIAPGKVAVINSARGSLGISDSIHPLYPVLCLKMCQNGGTLTASRECSCKPGFKGQLCEQGNQARPYQKAQTKASAAQNRFCLYALKKIEIFCDPLKSWKVGDECDVGHQQRRNFCD